jgi:REP element-mobilizing transposase RayT
MEEKRTIRRPTRYTTFDYNTAGGYFVTVCTEKRIPVLSRITVGADVLDGPKTDLLEYGKIAEKYIRQINGFYEDITVDQYVIMPDHIHMIIRLDDGSMWASTPTNATNNDHQGANTHIPPKQSISSIVRSIKTLTSKEIGESIFQRSYYDHVIRNQADYDEIWQYIENNPKKWALDRDMV